jgi:S-adenosyl-L-methionine hydrolase (adenosine-forming)
MPTIALLTDFGLQDHYVGAMKGAILALAPEATLVDLLHEIPAHDVLAGALALEAGCGAFPEDTVFLAVVDPGVGSARRPLAVEAGGWFFVAPDNGLLSLVLAAHPGARAHVITNPALARREISPVFHGRDLFGPVAAHLARGLGIAEVGPAAPDLVRLELPLSRTRDGWQGEVLRADRFGNLTTSLREVELEALREPRATRLEVEIGGRVLPLVRTYSDVREGEPCALVGSGGRLELAVNCGRADVLLVARRGTVVIVRRARAGSARS